jgi:AcrR family transcriptional regulator
MASSDSTKLVLSNAFVELVEKDLLDKVSVSDIIARVEKNRKTFYYHFEDKNHLIVWLFRYDLGVLLLDRFDPELLVFETKDPSKKFPYPYYTFIRSGSHSLDASVFFQALATCFENRRSYYAKVLKDTSRYSLREYLFSLYMPALENDIRFILGNRHMDDNSIAFLAGFYTDAFLGHFTRRACSNSNISMSEGLQTFNNIVHSSLEEEIRQQQIRRLFSGKINKAPQVVR